MVQTKGAAHYLYLLCYEHQANRGNAAAMTILDSRKEPRPASPLDHRRAGILLHPTSLPGAGKNGELGMQAYHFVDFLAQSGLSVWQTLPLGPTHGDLSPYQCLSVHAGNPLLISLDALVDKGWLAFDAAQHAPAQRKTVLEQAQQGFHLHASDDQRHAYDAFKQQQHYWLEDYALYIALRDDNRCLPWWEWPQPLRDRHQNALSESYQRLAAAIEAVRFEQFIFFDQWQTLRRYANDKGIWIFGDMPIFVAHDSVDVWANRDQFMLDAQGQAKVVAGVPPDYFSATGQRWGNPHYDWERMQGDGFSWWIQRVQSQLALFDIIRIDHFRGFEAYWEIPADAETAIHGRWVKAPGHALFRTLHARFDPLPLVAEDLGIITDEVTALRRAYSLPGMKVLQFAFGGDAKNPYLPHNHEPNYVVYTGTHDNDTTLGWFRSQSMTVKSDILEYLGKPQEEMPWPIIRSVLASPARLAIIPMQDVLMLGSEHRMNRPGVAEQNWSWRFEWQQVGPNLAAWLQHLATIYGR